MQSQVDARIVCILPYQCAHADTSQFWIYISIKNSFLKLFTSLETI